VARNRKRARDRRPGRSDDASGVVTAGLGAGDSSSPLSHATPDAELADAQLALGRPELADVPSEQELEEYEEETSGTGAEVEPRSAQHPAHAHESLPARTISFLRGSWRELQRVQWPDRQQVMQATGVVLGFVIVAGVFLGLSDFVAQKLVNFILK
jgi:preprotein translocase subunit SecE